MSDCICEPGSHNDQCPLPVPVDLTERRERMMNDDDPCAHCGAGLAYCQWTIFTADIGACCGPCRSKPLHAHEAP